jgi:two-component system, NtrC family, response regulator
VSAALPGRLLLVEDEEAQRRILAEILRKDGWNVVTAASGEEALAALEPAPPEVILCDWKMPGLSGDEVLAEVRRRGLPSAFVVMTAYGSIAHAVEAIRQGADDYLGKPFERDALLLALRRALRTKRLERENTQLRDAVAEQDRFGELLGRSEAMQRLFRTLQKVAAADATVLITGESGTGKELVARTLHRESARAAGPFVAVNCASIPETLIESELFGHERGAFTGAHRRREGKFEEAHGGTLFLDEIASMPLAVQASLLRVLQERRFTRLGGRGEVETDVRVVAASNRELARLVAEGSFREDLYYRLNVVPLRIPPLRERREDIPVLAEALLEKAARRHGRQAPAFQPAALRLLVEWRWPGNVRELSNLMERLVLLCEDGQLRLEELPEEMRQPVGAECAPMHLPPGGLEWDEMEASLLRQALERAAGNRTAAARLLGLGYKAFLYRLEKHGLG